jgi:tetratricopeptide (TPR) repeat protein
MMRHFTLILITCLWVAPSWATTPLIDEYRDKVEQIIAGFENGNAEPFTQALDVDAITGRATEDAFTNLKWKSDFRTGLAQGIKTGVGDRFLSQIAADSYIKLLRLKQEGEAGRALLRFDFGDNGNGYIELFLEHQPTGEVKVVDWYDYAMGQRYTTSLRQLVGIMAPTPTLAGKLFDIASDRKEVAETLKEIITLNKQQKHKALVNKFLAQDKTFRRSRLLNLIAIQSANQTNDMGLYRKVLANLAHYHGSDERLFFILIDYYFLEEKYDEILRGLDKLDAHFGVGDAGLEVYRANAYYSKRDYVKAITAANRAITLEPNYEYGYWSKLLIQTAQADYAGGVETIRSLEERFGYDLSPEALSAQEEYVDLVGSEAYRKWRGSQ